MIDSCSTGPHAHPGEPAAADDELGLIADYGLEYLEPDPVAHVAFPDGEQLTMWLRSRPDVRGDRALLGARRRRLPAADRRVRRGEGHLRRARAFTPLGFGPSLEERLLEHPRGRVWLRRNAMSRLGRDPARVRGSRTSRRSCSGRRSRRSSPVDAAGSGLLAYSIVVRPPGAQLDAPARRLRRAHRRARALPRGPRRHCALQPRVSRLVLEDGRCTGVETDDGERYIARARRALDGPRQAARRDGAAEAWGEEFLYGVERTTSGCPAWPCYCATTGAGVRDAGRPAGGGPAGPSAGPRRCSRSGGRVRDRRPDDEGSRGCSSPRHARRPATARPRVITRSSCSARRPGTCRTAWRAGRSTRRPCSAVSSSTAAVRARRCPRSTSSRAYVKSPEDIERSNPHMTTARSTAATAATRSAADAAGAGLGVPPHADPGLYQTGGTTTSAARSPLRPGETPPW